MSMEKGPAHNSEREQSLKERKQLLDNVAFSSEEDFGNMLGNADLSLPEIYAMKNWRKSSNLLEKIQRRDEVEKLYTQAKYPTLSKVLDALHIKLGPDAPYNEEFNELEEEEKSFTAGDFESALKKLGLTE